MSNKVFCPQCQELGLKSCVYVGTQTATLLAAIPYYDEDGNFHYQDPNTYTTSYSCSNGHTWAESKKYSGQKIIIEKYDQN